MGKSDKVMKVAATYEKDSKRFRRFSIGENKTGIVGTLYVPKGADAPEEFIVVLSEEDDE